MAMYEAIHRLDVMPDLLLIDAVAVDIPILQISIIHGDAASGSVKRQLLWIFCCCKSLKLRVRFRIDKNIRIVDIFDNFLSRLQGGHACRSKMQVWSEPPPPTMIRGFQPATLPDRFLKAVGDAQGEVLRHHHAEDPYPSGRFRRVISAAITIQKLLEGVLARCDK
jgi:hypothetical protein